MARSWGKSAKDTKKLKIMKIIISKGRPGSVLHSLHRANLEAEGPFLAKRWPHIGTLRAEAEEPHTSPNIGLPRKMPPQAEAEEPTSAKWYPREGTPGKNGGGGMGLENRVLNFGGAQEKWRRGSGPDPG